MVWFEEIPLVMPLAEFIWGTGEDESELSATICLSSLPLLTTECFQRLFVKALGVAIILSACLNKAPIIVNMWTARTAAGLAKASVYGDVIMYANAAIYGMLQGFPITAYGENVALLLQSFVVVALAWKFTPNQSPLEPLVAILVFGMYYMGSVYVLPDEYQFVLTGSITPVLLYSRGFQIWENYKYKHTGTQAIVTLGMNTLGGIVRIGTILAEVGWDIPVLMGYATGVALSVMLLAQYFLYKANTEKVLRELSLDAKSKQE